MFEIGPETQYDARNHVKPRSSAWGVYKRLLGYAFKHKFRLAISLAFALVVTVSFMSMLLGLAALVDVVFSTGGTPPPGVSQDDLDTLEAHAVARLVEKYGPTARDVLNAARFLVPWDAAEDDARLQTYIESMRSNKMASLKIGCALVLVAVLLAGVARYLQEFFAGVIGANISVELGEEMYSNVMRLSLGFFERHPTGELLARFTNDIFQVNRGLASVFVKLMREPVKAVGLLFVALSADPFLTVIGLCVLPPVAGVIYQLGRRFKKSVRRSLEKIAAMASVASETFSGIAIIKGFCMESYEIRRTREEFAKLRRYLYRMVRVDAAVGPVVEGVLVVGIVAFVLFAGKRAIDSELPADVLVRLVGALLLMLDPVRKLSNVNNLIQTSVASAERVFEFIDEKPDITERPGAVTLPRLRDTLRFENVRFAYTPGVEVLKGIDLEIRKGEMVAFVGFSGAGKSTLVKLLPRFYDVTGGAITVDGVDIRDATFLSLRGQMSIVTQETILFNESVRANIAFGQDIYSEERVRAAAQAAHAAEFIERLPRGYDAVIGEHGASLSGGQRQRLAIARAIIKDPAILILDEATSHLDSESERAIQEALNEFVVGRTTLVIAHRLSTVRRADRIVVLDQGEIAQVGSHDALLAQGGIYRRLYEQQLLANGDATA